MSGEKFSLPRFVSQLYSRLPVFLKRLTGFAGPEELRVGKMPVRPAVEVESAVKDLGSMSPIVFLGEPDPQKAHYSILPSKVSCLDDFIARKGFERGSTILISGGAGTGKTTFALQSIYNGAVNGERGIYISFEEQPEKIKLHMKENFGWDFDELERKGLVSILKVNPLEIARSLEESKLGREGGLMVKLKQIELPFYPDRICLDSLSALSISFEKQESYRVYLRDIFEALEKSNAVSFVLSETEQDPKVYSRTGVEEFLADGVIVLYNINKNGKRLNALEILKLRSSKHKKDIIFYAITPRGIELSKSEK